MRHDKFACFILTYGRPHNQMTYKSLLKYGYTGDIYFIIDDEDATGPEYRKLYGDKVICFCKEDAAKITDRGDIIQKKNTVLFARNMCHKIAEDLGLEYFLELDDDYNSFEHRYPLGDVLKHKFPDSLDDVFDAWLDFLDRTKALCVCFMQNGDFIGGVYSWAAKRICRKAMNAFFCRTDRPFKFVGRMNDDVSTYVTLGNRGHLFFSCSNTCINQAQTQSQAGGLTEMYLENGTYMKSFYTVMMCPSAVKISTVRGSHARYHHKINWNKCVPKILSPIWKKERGDA